MIVRPVLEQYATDFSVPEPAPMRELAQVTRDLTDKPEMMVGPVEGMFLAMLVRLVRAELVVEIGTFTGYSAMWMATALGPNGRVITSEIDTRHAELAEKYIGASPWRSSIDVRVGPALETIGQITEPIDFAFIDADKTEYWSYFEAILPKLRPGGLIAVDNTLHLGRVVAAHDESPDIVALRSFNERILADPRVDQVVLTVRQGITLISHARIASS